MAYLSVLLLLAVGQGISGRLRPLPKQRQNDIDPYIEKSKGIQQIQEQIDWPQKDALEDIQQVAGVDVDKYGNVHVFHRGDRVWDGWSFISDIYQHKDLGPINTNAVLILKQSSGEIIRSWGKNRFYLPHGLTLDDKENTWLTDVALHQVFKFTPNNEEPTLTLGEAFQPGSDHSHFCKPTDIAVTSSGFIFISDGYCNSRIIAFKPDGSFHGEFGQNENMYIPHSLSLIEEKHCLCVADRENARILCFLVNDNGSLEKLVANYNVPTGAVYAIANRGDDMFAVTLLNERYGSNVAMGITLNLNDGHINYWHPKEGFMRPHSMAISSNGTFLYVADVEEFSTKKLFKFVITDTI